MVTSKPVNRFRTVTGYRMYHRLSNLFNVAATRPRQRQGGVWQLPGPALHCSECRRPPFSRNSSVVGSVWTSVLATGRLSTSVVHVCCPSTWTVLSMYWVLIVPITQPWMNGN